MIKDALKGMQFLSVFITLHVNTGRTKRFMSSLKIVKDL